MAEVRARAILITPAIFVGAIAQNSYEGFEDTVVPEPGTLTPLTIVLLGSFTCHGRGREEREH